MIVFAIIIIILIILAFLRVGVACEYCDSGVLANLHIGPLTYKVYPVDEAKKERKSKRKEEKAKKKKEKLKEKAVEEKEKKPGTMAQLKDLLPTIFTALRRLKHKLTINELTIHYISAGEDAAKTAIRFGMFSTFNSILIPFFENNFKIKKRDFQTAVNFMVTEPYVYIRARLSLAIWEIVYIGWVFVKYFIKVQSKKRKAELSSGKASNRGSNGDNNAENQRDD